MVKFLRQSTLETIGLGSAHGFFSNGKLPVDSDSLVDKIFGPSGSRKSMVISGANGIVGAGKLMQLGSRLNGYDIPIIALDFPGAPDGIGAQYSGLASSFGKKQANEIMSNVIRLNYDGSKLPSILKELKPAFLLEAIPEILEIKKGHYKVFKENFENIEIRSVTSGFPSSELGVGIAHPAFPHQINKVWEIVENEPSDITKLFWALGMVPLRMTDNWAFVLDVVFCGLTLSCLRYNQASNMPYWKIDKYVRKYMGPNPFRAHDVIGAKGANFLTWSCLEHLSRNYGDVFKPTPSLIERVASGQNWYPMNHLRPVVNSTLTTNEIDGFNTWVLGSLFQMTSLMIHEKRSDFASLNIIGELCAQFRQGVLAQIRSYGSDKAIGIVEKYHKLHPTAGNNSWYKDSFQNMASPDWQQLYVNAEHDGEVGVITLGRESYNDDVNSELNRAIDWLKSENISKVILTGDFHHATQLVGADTSEFYPALTDINEGFRVSNNWSMTARRFCDEFQNSVAFINGKRCLGGMLELMMHCHYIVTLNDSDLGSPEVNLPVVPGMEMCHIPFRKTTEENWPSLFKLLLEGRYVKGKDSVGWLTDFSGTMPECLSKAWSLAKMGESAFPKRYIRLDRFNVRFEDNLSPTENKSILAARKAILDTVIGSCSVPYSEAVNIQSKHSAEFMISKHCKYGMVGSDCAKVTEV